MALGGGKYEGLCSFVRLRARAEGAIVMVFGGTRGSGFSVQAGADVLATLPEALRSMADQIEADLVDMPDMLTCRGCGRHLEPDEVRVLPGVPAQGIPAEVRCSTCLGEEARRG